MTKMTTATGKQVQLSPDEFPIRVVTSVQTEFGSVVKSYNLVRNEKGAIRIELEQKLLDKRKQ